MTVSTILLLVLSAFAAFGLSYYQYLFKAKKKGRLFFFLAFLRFITLFSIFLLLINPVITTKDLETVKTPLPVVVDNSQSIKELGVDKIATALSEKISSNKELKDKYEIQLYSFSDGFESARTLDFKGKQTHIDQVAQNLKQLYRNTNYPVVLITDGNQTIGNDYIYSFRENTSVYPMRNTELALSP